MDTRADTRLAVCQRHRARRLAYWNAALWAIGNGLTSSTLVIYLALELGVPGVGLGVGLIKAAPQIAGLLRLGTPALIARLGDRKRFCLTTYLLSGLVLLGLPLAAAPGWLSSKTASLAALVALWCLYHLLEYLGTVALWSWLADLVPLRIRGRFIGRRERWMVVGQAAAMLAAGLFTWGWHQLHPQLPRWIGYAIPAGVGVWFLIASLVPLVRMPRVASGRPGRPGLTLRSMAAPFLDRRFLRLLLFGCWFSFFNGITQSAQSVYPYRVLGMSLFVMLALQTGMRCGQWTISPALGRLADRWGNRPVMILSLPVVALGCLFHYLATPAQPWWLIGAWATWIAYAGLNVGLPNLMLKLSPREANTPYIAAFHATGGLCVAVSTIAGGWLLDQFAKVSFSVFGGIVALSFYQYLFLFGWLTRTMGVLLLWLIIEPRGTAASPTAFASRSRTGASGHAGRSGLG